MNAILAHPRAYVTHRTTVMWTMLTGDHQVGWFIDLAAPSQTLRPDDPVFRRYDDIHEALRQTPLFRVGVWVVVCALLTAAAWRRRREPLGAFIVATSGSAVVYVASYWPIAVATDYRYGYWAALAALAGIAVFLAQPPAFPNPGSARRRRRDTEASFAASLMFHRRAECTYFLHMRNAARLPTLAL